MAAQLEAAMLDVQLPSDLAEYVEAQVASGAYPNAAEVLRAGLTLLMEREGDTDEDRRAALVAALIEGEQSGPGESFDVEAFLAERASAA